MARQAIIPKLEMRERERLADWMAPLHSRKDEASTTAPDKDSQVSSGNARGVVAQWRQATLIKRSL